MSKFKVGDKVVRKPRKDNSSFKSYQGDFAYYVITDITTSGHWLQLDNFTDGGKDAYPWYADNFELYQEPGEGLPEAPASVLYYNSTTDADNFQHMLVQPHWELEGHLSIAIVKSGKKFDPLAYGDALSLNLEPDAALQLAHDMRRMAMEIKRKEKQNA